MSTPTIGYQILDLIIKDGMCTVHIINGEAVKVWSPNAAEQLEALVEQQYTSNLHAIDLENRLDTIASILNDKHLNGEDVAVNSTAFKSLRRWSEWRSDK